MLCTAQRSGQSLARRCKRYRFAAQLCSYALQVVAKIALVSGCLVVGSSMNSGG